MKDKIKLDLTISVPEDGAILALKRLGHIRGELLDAGWKVTVDQLKIGYGGEFT